MQGKVFLVSVSITDNDRGRDVFKLVQYLKKQMSSEFTCDYTGTEVKSYRGDRQARKKKLFIQINQLILSI